MAELQLDSMAVVLSQAGILRCVHIEKLVAAAARPSAGLCTGICSTLRRFQTRQAQL